MNKQLEEFARTELREGLAKCTDLQISRFKRMYSHDNLDASINEVVDKMPTERLDWAMKQVQNTLNKAI